MWIYLILFLIICVVVVMSNSMASKTQIEKLLLDKKNKKKRYRSNKKKRVYEGFDQSAEDMDEVLDYYCSTTQGKGNYIGYWDGTDTPRCIPLTCETEICHTLKKETLYPGIDHLYKYETTNEEKLLQLDGSCLSKANPDSNIMCGFSNPPTCPLNPTSGSNIVAYVYDPLQNWLRKECRYMFDSNGQCVLRDAQNPFNEVKIVDLNSPTTVVHGDPSATITYYDQSGPRCDLSWDGSVLMDDAGNVIDVEANNLDPSNPKYNHPSGAENYALCENQQALAYVHPTDSEGMFCEFAGDCDTCDYNKESCYVFDSTNRKYDRKNFIHTFLDQTPDNGIDTQTCGTYLVNSNISNTQFDSTDFSGYDQPELYDILNHNDQIRTNADVDNCAMTKGAECDSNNKHQCRLYNSDTRDFYYKEYKQIYDSTGNGCEYCPVNDCDGFANTKSNTDCPNVVCPVGMKISVDNQGVAQNCSPCVNTTHFYDTTQEMCIPFSQCDAGQYISNTILSNIHVDDSTHVHSTFSHEFITSNDDSNIVSLSDYTCEACPVNTITTTFNRSLECIPCDKGWYTSNVGSIECLPCPDGSYRSNGMLSCVACPAKHVPLVTKEGCRNCSAEFKKPNSSKTDCVECGNGKTFNVATSNCRDLCDNSNYWNVNTCSPIPGGKYKIVDTTNSLATFDVLSNCQPGFYRSNGMPGLACTPCPIGANSAEGASECTTCAVNAYWNGTNCVACDSNNQIINFFKNGCEMCPVSENKTNNADHTACVCKDEYHTHSISKVCVKCGNHQYWEVSSYSCTECPEGRVGSNQVGSQYCDNCPENTYRSNGMIVCEACPSGSYSVEGSRECTTCETNQYWDSNSGICERCPNGQVGTGGVGIDSCEPCPRHSVRDGLDMLECSPCETRRGFYTETEGASSCEFCGHGVPYDRINEECGVDQCAGSTLTTGYNIVTGSIFCIDCLDSGKIADKVNNVCVSCMDNATAQSNNTCVCDDGYFMSADGSNCVYCGPDSNAQGMYWSGDDCEFCSPGQYSTITGCGTCGTDAIVNPSNRTECICNKPNYHLSDDGINCFTCDNSNGFFHDTVSNSCSNCPPTKQIGPVTVHYHVSNDQCTPCGQNEVHDPSDRTKCECDDGYFRDPEDDTCDLCEGPRKYWNFNRDECTFCASNQFVYSNDGLPPSCVSCGSYSGMTSNINGYSCECVGVDMNGNPIPQDFLYPNANGLSCEYCNPENRKHWNGTACADCPNPSHYIDSNDGYSCKQCGPNSSSVNSPYECACDTNFVRNLNGDCLCEEDDRVLNGNNCEMCPSGTFARSNECVSCGANAQRVGTLTSCECVIAPGSNADYYHMKRDGLSCVYCDNTKGEYYDIATDNCIPCPSYMIVDTVNNRCGQCPNTTTMIPDSNDRTQCVCADRYFRNTLDDCEFCELPGQERYYDVESNLCVICDTANGYRVNATRDGCIKCGTNTVNNGGLCQCDLASVDPSEHIYYNMSGNDIDCIICDNRQNRKWNYETQECLVSDCSNDQYIINHLCAPCPQHSIVDPNNTTQCVCDTANGFEDDGTGQCVCEGNDRFVNGSGQCEVCDGNKVKFTNAQGVSQCVTCQNGAFKNTDSNVCECDESQFLYINPLLPYECVDCSPFNNKVWNGYQCLTDCDSTNSKIVPVGDGIFRCEPCSQNKQRGTGLGYSNCECKPGFIEQSDGSCLCSSNDRFIDQTTGECKVCLGNQVIYNSNNIEICAYCDGSTSSFNPSTKSCDCYANHYKANPTDINCELCRPTDGNYWTGYSCLLCDQNSKIVPNGDGTFRCELCGVDKQRSQFSYSNCECEPNFIEQSDGSCLCSSNDRFEDQTTGDCIVCLPNQVIYNNECRYCGANTDKNPATNTCDCRPNSFKADPTDIECTLCYNSMGNYWDGTQCSPCDNSNKIVTEDDGTQSCIRCSENETRGFYDYSNCYCQPPYYKRESDGVCVNITDEPCEGRPGYNDNYYFVQR